MKYRVSGSRDTTLYLFFSYVFFFYFMPPLSLSFCPALYWQFSWRLPLLPRQRNKQKSSNAKAEKKNEKTNTVENTTKQTFRSDKTLGCCKKRRKNSDEHKDNRELSKWRGETFCADSKYPALKNPDFEVHFYWFNFQRLLCSRDERGT